jgi:hypothetical protein
MTCRFGCECPIEQLTRVQYEDGCWCFTDQEQWLCPQHAIKGVQNNAGRLLRGYLVEKGISP